MSVARGFGLNGKSIYCNTAMPKIVSCQFTVAAADTGGLGVTSIKSNGYVRNVFLHTSATPGAGDGLTNPNPPAGDVLIQFKNNFNHFLGFFWNVEVPLTSSTTTVVSGLSVNHVYVITAVGTTTAAEWLALGVPAGIAPAVGVSFIALTTGTGGAHTGTVGLPSVSGIVALEVVGNPDSSIAGSSIAANGGAWIMLKFLNTSGSLAAPTDGSVVCLNFLYDGSSVSIDGL